AWDDYLNWLMNDKRMLKKVNDLIKDINRNHHEGLGKTEPLRHSLPGFWSRRINEEHRLIYRIVEDEIHIAQLRYHY
ncbi:MAG: Txe/YoeB family addiction module toxin, partial [Lentimonas sp.]